MMDITRIQKFLAGLPTVRALVVGDLMLDEYLWGRSSRISPEAPVPVVDVTREDLRLGGAGNVVNNLRSLGCRVAVCSVVGDDDDGRLLLQRLKQVGADSTAVIQAAERKTSRKTRIIASNQQMMRIDRESRAALSEPLQQRLLDTVTAVVAAGDADVVFISDYGKGVLTDALLAGVIAAARAAGIPAVVDPKGSDYRRYRGATLLTPNRSEAAGAAGIAIDDDASLSAAGERIMELAQLEALVITRSEEGMSIFRRGEARVDMPTRAREVFDVSGAGDTVLALVGLGLAAGLELAQAAAVANIAAGVVVAKVGTSTVSCCEIINAVDVRKPCQGSKIMDVAALQAVVERLRCAGRTVVFTNGCFDLLHAGHVSYLQRARALGDVLVLGLNSDASVRRLKGEQRPLVRQEDRAQVMAALACVDYVVIFAEDTPLNLITALRPDILVKGGDYRADDVVGAAEVRGWGGRVEIIDFVPERSTTALVERIRADGGGV